MRFLTTLAPSLLLAVAGLVQATSSWGFEAASISVSSKTGADVKDKLSADAPLSKLIVLGATDSLKVSLTATEDGKGKRPHQAFLLLQDPTTGLEAIFPLSVKGTGKAKVDITQKDLPVQLLTPGAPLQATLLLGSFGSSTPLNSQIFNVDVQLDPNTPISQYEKPERYGKLPTISHIFKLDAKSPPKIISLVFVLAVVAALPLLFGTWLYLDANLNQLSKAFSTAPISHALFYGSILAMEGIFACYYTKLNLFQTLPLAGGVGIVGFLSGSKALSEVQARRLAGER